jgi:splicing factor 3A subunit 2
MKYKDAATGARALRFELEYPEIEEGLQPRHRFMSAYEQKVEAPDRNWQYLLFAASPYETVAFKIPNMELDRDPTKFSTDWDSERKLFTLQLQFKPTPATAAGAGAGGAGRPTSASSVAASIAPVGDI